MAESERSARAEATIIPAPPVPQRVTTERIDTLKYRGKKAQERARLRATRAGKKVPGPAEWLPEIEWLEQFGYNRTQQAQALGFKDPRRIRQILTTRRDDGARVVTVEPEQVATSALPPEFQAMMPFTPEAFELFFNYFSPFKLAPHCKNWVRDFIDHPNVMINIPPRHAKSIIFSVWLPMWMLVRNREEQIILVSKTSTLATGFCQTIADVLEHSEIPKIFGRFKPEQSGDSTWRPSQGQLLIMGATPGKRGLQLSIQSRGMGQAILGMEATVVIVDDATDAEVARSDTGRENELFWLRENVLSRVMPEDEDTASGRAVVVGQRVHFRDLYGELALQVEDYGPQKGELVWHVIKYPAVIKWPEENGGIAEVLWPEERPFDYLMGQRARVGGSFAFETLFQQNPMMEGQVIFLPEWWEKCKDPWRSSFEAIERPEEEDTNFLPMVRVASFDPSPSQWNALTVADVLYPEASESFVSSIIELKHWKGGQRQMMAEMDRVLRAYDLDYLIFEHSGFTSYLKDDPIYQSIKDQVSLIEHHTGNNKFHTELGVQSLGGDIEDGRIRFPTGDEHGKEMLELFRSEMEQWPYGRTDDTVMTVWFIKWNAKRMTPFRSLSNTFTGKAQRSWSWVKGNSVKGDWWDRKYGKR